MIDSDQRPDSNGCPLLKSPSTNNHYLKSRSDLRTFSNWCPIQILRSMADLLVRVRAYVNDVTGHRLEKVRNNHRFENWTLIWEFEIGHRFKNWKPIWEFERKDIDLRYRCLWRRNRTWIWGLDVDLRLDVNLSLT